LLLKSEKINDPNLFPSSTQESDVGSVSEPRFSYPSVECAGGNKEVSDNVVVDSSKTKIANQGSNCTLYCISNKTAYPIQFYDAYGDKDYFIQTGEDKCPEVWLPLATETPSSLHILYPRGGPSRQLVTLYGKSDGDQLITVANETDSVSFPTHIKVPFVSSKGCLTIKGAHPKYRIECYRHVPGVADDFMVEFKTTLR
ncbi:OLC1v1018984C1, partial [Oldenlandia corymbosa var. corymbosa]